MKTPKRSVSSGRTLKARFEALVRELSAQKLSVPEIVQHKEVRGLFLQWQSPEAIIEATLTAAIRRALQDTNPETGERIRTSMPDLPFPNVPSRTQMILQGSEEETDAVEVPMTRRGYDLAEIVKQDPQRQLIAIEESLKIVRGHINRNPYFAADEKRDFFKTCERLQEKAARRLQVPSAA
jgi:hypothetical protein